jgi:hypothetical protein
VTDFANWPSTPEAVLKFTLKYGPLEEQHSFGADDKGSPFHFELRAWRAKQREFQNEWYLYDKFRDIPSSGSWIQVSPKEALPLYMPGKTSCAVFQPWETSFFLTPLI